MDTKTTITVNADGFEKLNKEAEKFSKNLKSNDSAISSLMNALDSYGEKLERTNRSLEKFASNYDKVSDGFGNMSSALSKASDNVFNSRVDLREELNLLQQMIEREAERKREEEERQRKEEEERRKKETEDSYKNRSLFYKAVYNSLGGQSQQNFEKAVNDLKSIPTFFKGIGSMFAKNKPTNEYNPETNKDVQKSENDLIGDSAVERQADNNSFNERAAAMAEADAKNDVLTAIDNKLQYLVGLEETTRNIEKFLLKNQDNFALGKAKGVVDETSKASSIVSSIASAFGAKKIADIFTRGKLPPKIPTTVPPKTLPKKETVKQITSLKDRIAKPIDSLKDKLAKPIGSLKDKVADTVSSVSEKAKSVASKGAKATSSMKAGLAKTVGKIGAKTLGKTALKQIPLLGVLAGLGFAAQRAFNGDFAGAGLEVLSSVPVVGLTAAGALAAKDIHDAMKETDAPKALDVTTTAGIDRANTMIAQSYDPLANDYTNNLGKGLQGAQNFFDPREAYRLAKQVNRNKETTKGQLTDAMNQRFKDGKIDFNEMQMRIETIRGLLAENGGTKEEYDALVSLETALEQSKDENGKVNFSFKNGAFYDEDGTKLVSDQEQKHLSSIVAKLQRMNEKRRSSLHKDLTTVNKSGDKIGQIKTVSIYDKDKIRELQKKGVKLYTTNDEDTFSYIDTVNADSVASNGEDVLVKDLDETERTPVVKTPTITNPSSLTIKTPETTMSNVSFSDAIGDQRAHDKTLVSELAKIAGGNGVTVNNMNSNVVNNGGSSLPQSLVVRPSPNVDAYAASTLDRFSKDAY